MVIISRTNIHWALLLLLVLIVGGGLYSYFGATGSQGVLYVETYPEGARIYINGGEVGTSPARISGVPLGLREVAITKDGYHTYTRSVQFNPGSERTIYHYLSTRDIETGPVFEEIATTTAGSKLHGDNFFIPTTDGRLFSVDKQSKDKNWTAVIEKETFIYTPTVVDDIIYLQSFYGPIYAIDSQNGDQLWKLNRADRTIDLLPVDNGLLVRTYRHNFFLMSYDGEIIWETEQKEPTLNNTFHLISSEKARVLTKNGNILSLHPETGKIETEKSFHLKDLSITAQENNMIAAANTQGDVLFWNKDDFSFQTRELDFQNYQDIFLAGNLLLFTFNSGEISAYDLENEEKIWEKQILTGVSAFAHHNDRLYFGTRDGSIFIIEKDGNLLAKRSLSWASRITSITPEDDPMILHVTNRGGNNKTLFLPSF